MKKRILQLGMFAFLLLGMEAMSYAQIRKEKKADIEYESFAYADAIQTYQRIVENGNANSSILEKLADAYYFNGKLIEANKWYSQLLEGDYKGKDLSKITSEYYYRYAQTLKAVGKNQEAYTMLKKFASIDPNDSRAKLILEAKENYLEELEKIPQRYDLQKLSINSEFSDYGTTLLGDKLIFTSARVVEGNNKKTHDWTNEQFTSLYETTISQDGSFSDPQLFSDKINTKSANEATAVFTADGQTMYFTRNNSSKKGNKKFNKENSSLLKIYQATKQADGLWGQVLELPFNSDDFNTAHPALTADGKWMYFSSDRKGTKGQSDIFRVAIYDDGKFGTVENLGDRINTEGRESFPFISKDNFFYFSSDGRPGFGGLDVYKAKLNVDGSFGTVVNMGAPVNSAFDDFSFYLDPKTHKGFVSSNRSEGLGNDNIYFLKEKKCLQSVEGKVFDIDTQVGIADSKITLFTHDYKELETVSSDRSGHYKFAELGCSTKYRLEVEAVNYVADKQSFELGAAHNEVKRLDIGLQSRNERGTDERDLFKTLQLNPIYFDFDKSVVRQDAKIELKKIVETMKQHPQMKVDVRSHTDSRGNSAYNLALSDRRVKATIDWMIEQGVEANRLTGKGFGDRNLQNNCKQGVRCSAKEHELNRRSEFIIIKK